MLYQSIQSCDLIVSAYMQTLMTVIDFYPNACTHFNCGQGKTIRKWEQHTKFRYRQKKRLYLLFCLDLVFLWKFCIHISSHHSFHFCKLFNKNLLFLLLHNAVSFFCCFALKLKVHTKMILLQKKRKQRNPQKNWIDAPEKVCCDSRRPADPMINAIIINLNGA